jgi:hypothetical protein
MKLTKLSHRATALVTIVLLVGISTGCRSMRELPAQTAPTQPPTWQVQPGDTIRVTLANGRRVRFKVAAVDNVALVAVNGNRYPLTGVTRVERRQFSGGRTAVLVIGGFLVAALTAVVIAGGAILAGSV